MRFDYQRRLAASILKIGVNRVYISPDPQEQENILDAITRDGIRGLIRRNVIQKRNERGVSRGREGRTDYRVRAKLLRSGKPRVVVRKTLNQTIVQFVVPDAPGDNILATAQSIDLKEHGWSAGTGNLPAAYLTGFLAGRRASAKGLKEAILDIGGQRPSRGGRLFAALQGLLDAGVLVPHSPEVLPAKDRVRGAHIGEEIARQFDAVKSKLEAA